MNDDTGAELPPTLQTLWGQGARRQRGPVRALTLERIVEAAIAIADAEGLDALSMARLAKRLGSATMSLYRHIASKEELLVFMLDTACGPAPRFPEAPADWRAELTRWAKELRAVYHRHPWILYVMAGPPLDPGQLAWLDAGLRTLGGTPLRPDEKLSTIMIVLYYTRGDAQLSAPPPETADVPEPGMDHSQTLARLVDPGRFPALSEVIAAGAFSPDADPGPDASFVAGLERILDGIDALIRRRTSPS